MRTPKEEQRRVIHFRISLKVHSPLQTATEGYAHLRERALLAEVGSSGGSSGWAQDSAAGTARVRVLSQPPAMSICFGRPPGPRRSGLSQWWAWRPARTAPGRKPARRRRRAVGTPASHSSPSRRPGRTRTHTHARTHARSLALSHARTHARAHTLETRGRPASRDCLATRCRGPHASVQVGISESRSSEMPERRQHSQAPGSRGRSLRPGVRTVRAGNRAGNSGSGSQDPRALAGGPAESGPGLPVPAARPNCQWRP